MKFILNESKKNCLRQLTPEIRVNIKILKKDSIWFGLETLKQHTFQYFPINVFSIYLRTNVKSLMFFVLSIVCQFPIFSRKIRVFFVISSYSFSFVGGLVFHKYISRHLMVFRCRHVISSYVLSY